MSAITIDNNLVHYEVLGRGRPVILLHGWLGSWRYWIPTMQQLGMKYRVYAIDLWGFGDTEKDPARYSFASQVKLLMDFMEKLGIGKAAIVGHALGAAVSITFARQFPERAPRVVLISPPLFDLGGITASAVALPAPPATTPAPQAALPAPGTAPGLPAPAATSLPASASTPAVVSAPATPAPKPAPVTGAASTPAPTAAPISQSATPAPVTASAPAPTPATASAPAPASAPAVKPAIAPTPVTASAPVPASVPAVKPATTSVPAVPPSASGATPTAAATPAPATPAPVTNASPPSAGDTLPRSPFANNPEKLAELQQSAVTLPKSPTQPASPLSRPSVPAPRPAGVDPLSAPFTRPEVNPLVNLLSTINPKAVLERHLARDPENLEKMRGEVEKMDNGILQRLAPSFQGINLAQQLSQLTTPVLLFHGREDAFFEPNEELINKIGALKSDGMFLPFITPEFRHFPMLEQSIKFNRLLTDFLDAPDLTNVGMKETWRRQLR